MAASVKYDEGTGFASNCFPVRGVFSINPNSNGEGAWMVAQRSEEKRRFRAVLCSQPKTYSQIKEERRRAEKVEKLIAESGGRADGILIETEDEEEPVLDGFLMLRGCCVEDPADACSISIPGQGISEAKSEDFALFDNVAYVNAAENFLPLEIFSAFPIIRELELPLNALRGITITRYDFPELEILDLSYNNVSHEDILALGLIPKLRVLHLSGNGLTSLPDNMAKPYVDESWYKTPRFPSLEILMLDDNKLTEVSTFSALAGLKRLKVVSLSKNEIEYVPQLKLVDQNKRVQESRGGARLRLQRPKSARRTPRSKTPGSAKSKNDADVVTEVRPESPARPSNSPDKRVNTPDGDSPITPDQTIPAPFLSRAEIDAAINEALVDQEDELPPPFSMLRCLDLSQNKISEEESVLPVALWPLMAELILYDNPLTRHKSGPPPLLKKLLVDRLGINLIRKKPSPVSRPPVEIHDKLSRKINSTIPKVPKIPVEDILAIEAPKLTPITSGSKTRESVTSAQDAVTSTEEPVTSAYRIGSREAQRVRDSFADDERGLISRESQKSVTFMNDRRPTPKRDDGRRPTPKRDSVDASPIPEETRASSLYSKSGKSSSVDSSSRQSMSTDTQNNRQSAGSESGKPQSSTDRTPLQSATSQGRQSSVNDESNEGFEKEVDPVVEEVVEEEDNKAEASGPDVDPVFLTQVGEEAEDVAQAQHIPHPPSNQHPDRKSTSSRRPIKKRHVPEKYKGYEDLLEDENEASVTPVGKGDVHSTIRALKYCLNHPVTIKPQPATLHQTVPDFKPYKKTQLPPPPVLKTRSERIDSALRKVKHREVVSEAPLQDVIQDKGDARQRFPKALQLLAQVQTKYNQVRINSLQDAQDLHDVVQSAISGSGDATQKPPSEVSSNLT